MVRGLTITGQSVRDFVHNMVYVPVDSAAAAARRETAYRGDPVPSKSFSVQASSGRYGAISGLQYAI